METDEDYLQMSGIQHFVFCRRQWALIHIEKQWVENVLTAEGRVDHQRCHDSSSSEKRCDLLTVRGMRVASASLKMSGQCDVVEFRRSAEGVTLRGRTGRWNPMAVEYKHGASKETDADRIQLCAETIALEEMLVCRIEQGAIFYEQTKSREYVRMTDELREATKNMSEEMWNYFRRGYTPKVKVRKGCINCSLKEICLPKVQANRDVEAYIEEKLKESP